MRKLFLLLSLLVVASMVLTACGGTPATATEEPAAPPATEVPATEAPAGPILRVNSVTFPDIVDPQKSSFSSEIAVLTMVYEGLTALDGDLNTVPGAAESWEYNDDATEVSFTLREGLTYSDGSPLNAARFEYAFRRNVDPATAGEYASITDDILGAAEFRSGVSSTCQAVVDAQAALDAAKTAAEAVPTPQADATPGPEDQALLDAVTAAEEAAAAAGCTDDEKNALKETAYASMKASHADGSDCTGYDDAACNTFTLKFKQPAPYFHTVSSLWVGYPAKQELIEAGGENWWLDAANHVGNGPFIMTNLEQGVNIHYTPNTNYWGTVPSYELDYSYIVDSAVAFEAYKNNELDIVVGAAEDFATIQADPVLSQEHMLYPGSCTFAVMFHQLKEPFTDPAVRAAFAYALDREGWVKDVLQGLGSPTLTWIPPGFPGYKEGETRFGFDAAKAMQTLTDAGYTIENGQLTKDGKAFPIELTFSDSPRNRTRFEWLAAKFKETLGLDFPLNPVEATTYTNLTKDVNTAPQMFILGWCADYPDPQNWLSVYWKTGAFGERIGFSNPELDALMGQADAELDATKRADLYQQAQDMLVEGGYVAFMWNNVNTYLVKPWVKGITSTPMDSNWPGQQVPTSITVEPH